LEIRVIGARDQELGVVGMWLLSRLGFGNYRLRVKG
jgi:hypothetical protein